MLHWRVILSAVGPLLALMVSGVAWAEEPKVPFDHGKLAQQELERHIRPGYQAFAQAAHAFETAVSKHCADGARSSRKSLSASFDALVSAWGKIEHLAFGPVTTDQRLERIMFWPDRRSIGQRQIAKALRERDQGVLDPHALARKSVALQGLPALEAVLFSGDLDAAARKVDAGLAYRCGFAAAISVNLSGIADAVAAEWSASGSFAKSWLAPGPGNSHFLKPTETTLALAKSLDLGLERVRDQYLAGPLGLNAQRRKISPPLGKSGRTMTLVVASIAGLRSLYVGGGMEQALIDAKGHDPVNTRELSRLVGKEMATAAKEAKVLLSEKSPFEGAAARRVIALGFPLKNARTTAVGLLSAATDLPLGFNASDGD